MIEVKELTRLERLKLSLEHSISEKYRKILKEKINKLENPEKQLKSMQQSFL